MMRKQWTDEEQAAHRKILCEALRSGYYNQATSFLRVRDDFCCLGVACDLVFKQRPGFGKWMGDPAKMAAVKHGHGRVAGPERSLTDIYALPNWACEFYGFQESKGTFSVRPTEECDPAVEKVLADIGVWDRVCGDVYSLAEINDQGGTFEQIADVIEAEPTGLVG